MQAAQNSARSARTRLAGPDSTFGNVTGAEVLGNRFGRQIKQDFATPPSAHAIRINPSARVDGREVLMYPVLHTRQEKKTWFARMLLRVVVY